MTPSPYEFILCALAVFRLAHMIAEESGPMRVFRKLRAAPKKGTSLREGVACPYCWSLWLATIIVTFLFALPHLPAWAIATGWFIVTMLALSGAAILFHQAFTWLRRE